MLVIRRAAVYHAIVINARHTPRARPRLLVTLVTIAALLLRVAIPAPAMAAPRDPRVALTAAGVALCTHDQGDQRKDPLVPAGCDHCDLCAAQAAVLPGPAVLPAPMTLAVFAPPPALNPIAAPRAPPGWAHAPRAPPALI